MVWFQCEDCGENLKKPKLPSHFRICSAFKLSCIDCGEMFGQQSVQSHTQCITEAEKYGPKGQAKVSNGTNAKSNKDSKKLPDIDINVGLSQRPPWFCSLCNTKATSRQALLLHAEGKKHKAKARAHHAANQQPQQTESALDLKVSTVELSDNKQVEEPKVHTAPTVDGNHTDPVTVNGKLPSIGKRERLPTETDGIGEKTRSDAPPVEAVNGEVIQAEKVGEAERSSKKAKHNALTEETEKKIKWKKLIVSSVRSNPDGVVKLKKLIRQVLKGIQESGVREDETQLRYVIENKIKSSSRFAVDGKHVRLVAKD